MQTATETNTESYSILFVDDEPGVLKSLRRLFIDEEWKIFTATCADEALSLLESRPIDMVVSDIRMPGMNGVDFLYKVKDRFPGTVRIFLSSYDEDDSVTRALASGCAQQLVAKPWDEDLKEVITTALRQSKQLTKRPLRRIIDALEGLPPLPSIYQELKDYLAEQDDFNIDQVVRIISRDPAISSALLRWGNSALFGHRAKVDSIKHAAVLMGIDVIESLVLSASINRSINLNKQQLNGYQTLQQHSVACAIMARLLAQTQYKTKPKLADQAFISGLLHDTGLLAEASLFSEELNRIQMQVNKNQVTLIDAEMQVLQTNHAEVGATLAEWWSLPSHIVNAIRWHHAPDDAEADQQLVALVAMADYFVTQLGINYNDAGTMNEAPDLHLDERLEPEQYKQLIESFKLNFNQIIKSSAA